MEVKCFLAKLQNEIQKYGISETVVGFSGGEDSTVLLHSLWQLKENGQKIKISAFYSNHGLSKNADFWENHCRSFCAKINIPFFSTKLNITKDDIKKLGVEAAARKKRYGALTSFHLPITLAHHKDDQSETILLQLLRSAGPKGLSGMPVFKQNDDKIFFRPFLIFSKKEIHDYALAYNLSYVEDESNRNINFERNFLRHEVIPKIREKWPNFENNLAIAANNCAKYERLAIDLAKIDYQVVADTNDVLLIDKLLYLSRERQNNLLRYFLFQKTKISIGEKFLTEIYKIIAANSSNNAFLKIGEFIITKYKNKLFLLKKEEFFYQQKPIKITWNLQNDLFLPDDLGVLAKNHFIEELQKRIKINKRPYQKIFVEINNLREKYKLSDSLTKTKKNILYEYNIPKWRQSRAIFVFDEYDELIEVL